MWPFSREVNHIHYGYRWDNFYEICKCGVSAGEYRNGYGHRVAFFNQWPDFLRKAKGRY